MHQAVSSQMANTHSNTQMSRTAVEFLACWLIEARGEQRALRSCHVTSSDSELRRAAGQEQIKTRRCECALIVIVH